MIGFVNLPPQQLPFTRKTKKWRKQHLDWADSKTFFNYSPVRKSVMHKKINYDLMNGILHMSDLELIINPDGLDAGFIPDNIQHYPIINSKLSVLRGEEHARLFDYRVVVTDPNGVSKVEQAKRDAMRQYLIQLIQSNVQSEEEMQQKVEEMQHYFAFEWQDHREVRANALLQHYTKELNMQTMFNAGFMDGCICGEEIYQCDIEGGEPVIRRLNPLKVRVFKSGYSNKIEDADIIIIEDYWSPGKVIDTYYDVLTPKDRKYIEEMPDNLGTASSDSMDNIDDRLGFVNGHMMGEEFANSIFSDTFTAEQVGSSLLPFDTNGNIRVLKMYWKSRRKIKKVKQYDLETGEPTYTFYPENYVLKEDMGEEEEIYYINEAWEGVKIGQDVYVNMRPRPIQYNRLSNPSRCHFGIVGSIYNLNDNKPFSFVDMMKPYSYLYDAVHDRLNKLIARSWGKLIQLDLAKKPDSWPMEQWLYYAKSMNLAVINSFNEGQSGAAAGRLAASLNNNTTGVIDAELGQSMQAYLNLLSYIMEEMSQVVGITRQREGQVANRETVGGIERATLQSSYITEWVFTFHDDVKKRALECFLETAKIALKGTSKKFEYLLSDGSLGIMDIDGDEYAECDYGLVVEDGQSMQKLNQNLDQLAQAALQNQAISFSSMMKLYTTASLAEKQRMIETEERKMQQMAQQQQQQQLQLQQQQMQQQAAQAEAQMQQTDTINTRDNETKLLIAQINANTQMATTEIKAATSMPEDNQAELEEEIRQFNEKLKLDRDKLRITENKYKRDAELKEKQIAVSKIKKQTNN